LWIFGIFLFNMTMPITLVVISNTFQGRQGFAFGLTTLALIIGALPYYARITIWSDFVNFWDYYVVSFSSFVWTLFL
jgi:hypothetical protein